MIVSASWAWLELDGCDSIHTLLPFHYPALEYRFSVFRAASQSLSTFAVCCPCEDMLDAHCMGLSSSPTMQALLHSYKCNKRTAGNHANETRILISPLRVDVYCTMQTITARVAQLMKSIHRNPVCPARSCVRSTIYTLVSNGSMLGMGPTGTIREGLICVQSQPAAISSP